MIPMTELQKYDQEMSKLREELRNNYERANFDIESLIRRFDNYARVAFNFGVQCERLRAAKDKANDVQLTLF